MFYLAIRTVGFRFLFRMKAVRSIANVHIRFTVEDGPAAQSENGVFCSAAL